MEKPNRSKVLDNVTVVGQDSITRFGDKKKGKIYIKNETNDTNKKYRKSNPF